MREWLRETAAELISTTMRSRALRARLEEELAADSDVDTSVPSQQNSDEEDDDEMPPLLEAEPAPAQSVTSTSSAPSPPTPSSNSPSIQLSAYFFSFNPSRSHCTADYGCCLRYKLSIGPCCMPSKTNLHHVQSLEWMQKRIVQLHADERTLEFLRQCDRYFYEHGWLSLWGLRVGLLKPLLRRCMAHTNVNGWLSTGKMFLASQEQLKMLLQRSVPRDDGGSAVREWPWSEPILASPSSSMSQRRSRFLDIGAGDGHITSELASLFDDVVTTEVAGAMVRALRKRGWACVHTADLDEGLPANSPLVGEGFDCVSLFNVLDRCAKPRTLLRQIRARMRRSQDSNKVGKDEPSRLLLSVPLPLDPSVEMGTYWTDPDERIILPPPQTNSATRATNRHKDFETSVIAMAEWLCSEGWCIESVSRIPYISEGDTRRPFYVLEASLWVLSFNDTPINDTQGHNTNSSSHGGHAHNAR